MERDDPRVQWVAEGRLPVSLEQVRAELRHIGVTPARAGWYFQQLLKLLARQGRFYGSLYPHRPCDPPIVQGGRFEHDVPALCEIAQSNKRSEVLHTHSALCRAFRAEGKARRLRRTGRICQAQRTEHTRRLVSATQATGTESAHHLYVRESRELSLSLSLSLSHGNSGTARRLRLRGIGVNGGWGGVTDAAVRDLSEAYLVLDADVVLLAPLTVLSADGYGR